MRAQEITRLEHELMLLTRHPSIGQLSAAFRVNASTVHRQTAAIVRAGLAERIPDPDGGMARKFQLTENGRDRLRQHHSWSVQASPGSSPNGTARRSTVSSRH
ncbi:MarR family winged helix-turn-helix transcriptional regulator [Pseudofrankia asymbiotica]|uniref:HTH marR-type domain-containing protein n=1 Tax=Pseudofrankia asymbiotica TaxID=1834516 RepID=A0A1V2IHG1_9ACTN|nr:MarR family winged helix-turn-helix transcriptional regulator [Pseudofrankia asymbiotica]ONH32430.1 hypothetical protein BL253_05195 [Pseudofrankia asymbiotica]